MMHHYPEINRHGLTEYHKQRLCYPFTDVPAFTFWGAPSDEVLPEGICPIRSWQDGRCALCGFRDRLVEDHDHDTGLVRGMLCQSCNTTEGFSGHNLGQWRNGVTTAAALGVEKVYVDVFGQTPLRHVVGDDELDRIAEMLT